MGLPGSGKTSWAKEQSRRNGGIIIGRDDIRYMLRNNYNYDNSKGNQQYVWDVSQYMIKESIKRGFDTILDQMSLTRQIRIDTIKLIKKYSKTKIDIILVYCSEDKDNVERRMNSDMVWGDREYYEKLINKMKYKIELPDLDKEDFNSIIRVPGLSGCLQINGE